jgi:hypothetical protein
MNERNPKAEGLLPKKRPKAEGRNPKEGRIPNAEFRRVLGGQGVFALREAHSPAFLDSHFGFRVSGFFRISVFGLRTFTPAWQ